jgi:hypothetical protein
MCLQKKYISMDIYLLMSILYAKSEFASSITTRSTYAFDACFVWKRTKRLFHKISIATIDAIEHVQSKVHQIIHLYNNNNK